jgi:uncharacterized RDD family membrane protein YckC
MNFTCPHCQAILEFAGKKPLFCAYCGQALPDTQPDSESRSEAATLTAPSDTTAGKLAMPETIGGYRLLRQLGSGGMGTVFEAEESASGRHVALKLVLAHTEANGEALARFGQEGRLASAISHPRCVFVLAADEEAARPYIVMELMPGETLEDLVKRQGPLPPEEAVAKILDVIEGLQEAHKLGVIHRDVKPSNCFLEADGRVKVGDFGLSKSLAGDAHLTKTGAFMGTPLYASPEQIRVEKLDPLTDLYSAAATLYFLLTGRAPQQTGDAVATMAAIVADPAPSMRRFRPELSPTLDKVVLRALERDRQRRYRDLEELKQALEPFLPSRLSIGGMGIRLGAYVIDYFLLTVLSAPLWVAMRGSEQLSIFDPRRALEYLRYAWMGGIVWIAYYTVLEGLWGCSLGKRWLGLRVQTSKGDVPGLPRALLRAIIFELAWYLGVMVSMVVRQVHLQRELSYGEIVFYANLVNFINMAGVVTGMGLLLSPMRARNGYRGVHDFATGTRVVRLPPAARRRTFPDRTHQRALTPVEESLKRLGPFDVHGVLQTGTERVLLGSDPALGRTVWIWLRPVGAPPLPAAHRDLARGNRPRWLAGGEQEGWNWDAFLAAPGSKLTDIVAEEGTLGWRDARPLIEQLCDEVRAACADRTLPARLELDQLWIQPNGNVQLVDFPLDGESAPITVAGRDDPGRAVAFVGQAVRRVLEPSELREPVPRNPDATGTASGIRTLRARLPDHARRLLAPLFTPGEPSRKLEDLQRGLQESRTQPTEVTRYRRAAQLGIGLALTFLGPCFCLIGATLVPTFSSIMMYIHATEAEIRLQALEGGARADFVRFALSPELPVRIGAVAQLDQDLELQNRLAATIARRREQQELRLQSSSRLGRLVVSAFRQSIDMQISMARDRGEFQSPSFRWSADWAASHGPSDNDGALMTVIVATLICPVLAVIWAFAWRGGLSYRLAGIDLVRVDGRPAARWQCAWRTLLFWLPVVGLFILSSYAEISYWSRPEQSWLTWLAWLSWWAAIATMAGAALAVMWLPTRSLFDRLAGTYLVPR